MAQDADDGAVRTMPRSPSEARLACVATAVDVRHDAPAGVLPGERHADELVPEHAAKALVAANELEVRVADAGAQDADENLAGRRHRLGPVGLQRDPMVAEHNRSHV